MTKEAGPATPSETERVLRNWLDAAKANPKNEIGCVVIPIDFMEGVLSELGSQRLELLQAERRAAELEAKYEALGVEARRMQETMANLSANAAQDARDAERFRLWKENCSAELLPGGNFRVYIDLPTQEEERMGPAIDALSASKGGGVGE